jgi:hypothetical protein
MSNPFASPSLASFQGDVGKGYGDSTLLDVLTEHRVWIRVCGIVSIIVGVLVMVGVWTIVIAWLPIWQGIVLLNAATLLSPGGSIEMKHAATRKLALYFKLMGIFSLIYFGLMALIVGGYIVMGVIMMSRS